jgi:H+/Cl- antiporter ClcA
MNQEVGKWIIIAGAFIVLAGVLIYFLGNKLNWLGHLPGDIRIERENFRFYFPITTMIVTSLLLTLVLHIIRRFL